MTKTKNHLLTWGFGIILFIILILADRITKQMAVMSLKDEPAVSIIKNVFQLQYLENRGAAFGILQGQRSIFLIITLVILIIIFWLYVRMPYQLHFLPLRLIGIFIAAGATGNFIDRMVQGYVVDFFYFSIINFPIFNVADIYVTCSAAALIIYVIFFYSEKDFQLIAGSLKIRPNQREK